MENGRSGNETRTNGGVVEFEIGDELSALNKNSTVGVWTWRVAQQTRDAHVLGSGGKSRKRT